MRISKRIVSLMIAAALTITIFSTNVFAEDTSKHNVSDDYLKEVMDLIREKYNGNISEDELIKAAVKGMFGSLDQFCTFYSQNEFNSVTGTLNGSVEGIGVQFQLVDKYATVLKVYSNSPAQKAGMLSGDRIVEVNGQAVVGIKLDELVSKVKGAEGTSVKLGILRPGKKEIITLEIKREKVSIPCVNYEIRGDIGYIHIDSFSANTVSGIKEALDSFDAKKIVKVVLDLRNNPGGLVDQAVEAARLFVPKGLITKLDYKEEGIPDNEYYSELDKVKYNLAVLVNENSASAAEILTGAIQDRKSGIIIGTKTYGKAKVQGFTPILSKEAYDRLNKEKVNKTVDATQIPAFETDLLGWGKMTIGMYYTPNGNCIDLKGIEPNIKVDNYQKDEIDVNLIEKLSMTVKPTLNTEYSEVMSTECILKLLKYDVDAPDMKLDNKTFSALKKFQKDNKIHSYGTLDFTTQKLLNGKLQELKMAIDTQYKKAVETLK